MSRRSLFHIGAGTGIAHFTILPARAATEFRLTHPAEVTHPVHTEAEKMARRIQDRTSGEVRIRIFPSNALGSPVEAAQQTRLGAIDLILCNPANLEALSRTIAVINQPYQFDSYEHAHRVLDVTARDWLSQQLRTAGFTWIANFEWGFRALSNSRRPVDTPADVQGLKLRVPPELAIKAAFEALGANIQTIAFQEVYLALSNKTVDGQDNPIGTTYAAKFFEVQSHIALTRHIYAPIMFLANPRSWNRLKDEQREIFIEEATAAGNAARAGVRNQEEFYLAEMQKTGVAITRPDVAPFRDKMGPAYEQLRRALGEEVSKTWSSFVEAGRGTV
ncbi:TRAP transporter substrate-binding protein [Teichococcus vastitatis]|uniref:TRAP transporter substrate-binding protein n=1 Tax=Teichococcus vastitatis TaxID=2307076 RepID=UPI0034628A6E